MRTKERFSLASLLACLVLLYGWTFSVTTCAQTHVDLGLDAAKTYSVSAAAWVPATVPSVTVTPFDGATVSLAAYFDRGYFFEHDLTLAYERAWRDRFTVTTSTSRYSYRDRTRDWAWSAGLRMRVR